VTGRLVVVGEGSGRADEVVAAATVVHREAADTATVVEQVAGGATVVLVAPGPSAAVAGVVAAVVDAGLPVEVVPAPAAPVAALVASGRPTDRFAVEAPLPPSGPERAARLAALAGDRRTTVLPVPAADRAATLADVAAACGPDRPVDATTDGFLVVAGAPETDPDAEPATDDAVRAALRDARDRGLSPGRAAAEVAAALGRPRREVYALGAEDEA
jgi:16S rRNA (cytidine1402-2'-O)-methyltransferase